MNKKQIKNYKSQKHLIPLLLCLLMAACTTPLPREKSYSIPFEHFAGATENNAPQKTSFTLSPRDIINVMFHFNTVQAERYRITPHDKINIQFLSAPQYDNIYQIRPDGYLSLPLLGDTRVKGLTVAELQKHLSEAYSTILKRPAFFVSVAEYQVHLKEIRQSLEHPNLGQARQITVRDDYLITMPFIGEFSVHEKSMDEITKEANDKYEQTIPGLTVDMLLHESYPREIYVFGEVNKPGSYRVTGPTSIFAAIALAGGPSHEANLDTVLTMTKEGDEMAARTYNFNDLLLGKAHAVNLYFDDIVYVPRTQLSSMAQIMNYVSSILLFRGIDIGYTYRLND